jgi:transposase
MDHIGIDVHKKESQICILGAEDAIIERRVRTTPERFADVLGDRPRARILLEASTESEWVARCLERLGHEVVVADPNFAPMYATRSRRIKTDRRDARALAEACRLGAYRPTHRLSDAQRHVRGRLTVRDALVRTRTGYISVIRARLCKFSVNLRHLFSAGLRHLSGHCLRDGQSRSRREGECFQPWREARSSS